MKSKCILKIVHSAQRLRINAEPLAYLKFLCFFKELANYRRQQGKRSCHEEEQANGTSEEDVEVAITHNQGANEVLFCHTTVDYANDDCRHGEAKLVEEVPYKAGSYH